MKIFYSYLFTLAFAIVCPTMSSAQVSERKIPTSADVSARVEYPFLRVPFLKNPPTIDGNMEPGEWEKAAGYTGFWQDYGHDTFLNLAYHEKQATFWIGYDDEYIYYAHSSPVFPRGAWLKAAAKYKDVLFHPRFGLLNDDHTEFQIRPDNDDINRAPFFKWLSNPTDVTVDLYNPGNEATSVDFEVNTEFETKGNWPDNDVWITEYRIPLEGMRHKDVEDLELPIRDGTVWRHWTARGIGGTGMTRFFSAATPGGWLLNPVRLEFSSNSVSAQVTELGPLMDDGVDFQLILTNHTDHNEVVRVGFFIEDNEELILKAEEDEFIDMLPGESKTVRIEKENIGVSELGNSTWLDIRTMGGDLLYRSILMPFHTVDGFLGYDQQFVEGMQFARPRQQPFYLKWAYYPSKDKIYVEVDTDVFGANPDAQNGVEVRAVLQDEEGNELAFTTFPLERPQQHEDAKDFGGRNGSGFIEFDKLPEGSYRVLVLLFDDEQKVVADHETTKFRQKEFPWIGEGSERVAIEDTLWDPYIELKWNAGAKTLDTLNHTFTLDPSGLLGQIEFKDVAGAEGPQLRDPIRFETTVGEARSVYEASDAVKLTQEGVSEMQFEASGKAGPVELRSKAQYDADGFLTYDVYYKTAAGKSIDTLELVMDFEGPMDLLSFRDRGTFFNQTQFEQAFEREGPVVWNSRDDAQSFELFYGNFLPYVMLGNGDRAFLWVCETDKGMRLLEENIAMQVEKNEEGEYSLRVFFVNEPGEVAEERHVRFGFMTLPTKPKPEDFRKKQWDWEAVGVTNTNMHDSSSFYDYHMQNDEDYDLFKNKPLESRPYTTTSSVSWLIPELQFLVYNGELLGNSENVPSIDSDEPPPALSRKHPVTKRPQNTVFHHAMAGWKWSPAMVDSQVYWRSRAIEMGGVQGWWWDLTGTLFAQSDHDPVVGNAYDLPEHKAHMGGHRQYGFHFFDPRDFFKRLARVISADDKENTNAHYGGVQSAFLAPFIRDQVHWEHAAGYTGKTPHMQNWGDDDMRLFANNYTGLLGYVIDDTYKDSHPSGTTIHAGADEINDRSVIGNALLHDKGVDPKRRANSYTYKRVREALEGFGYFNPSNDVEFVPYWRNDMIEYGRGFELEEWATEEEISEQEILSKVKISYYKNAKTGKVLAILGNYSGEDLSENIVVNPELLGKTLSRAYDPENEEQIPLMQTETKKRVPNTTMPVHIGPYQFRMIDLK